MSFPYPRNGTPYPSTHPLPFTQHPAVALHEKRLTRDAPLGFWSRLRKLAAISAKVVASFLRLSRKGDIGGPPRKMGTLRFSDPSRVAVHSNATHRRDPAFVCVRNPLDCSHEVLRTKTVESSRPNRSPCVSRSVGSGVCNNGLLAGSIPILREISAVQKPTKLRYCGTAMLGGNARKQVDAVQRYHDARRLGWSRDARYCGTAVPRCGNKNAVEAQYRGTVMQTGIVALPCGTAAPHTRSAALPQRRTPAAPHSR